MDRKEKGNEIFKEKFQERLDTVRTDFKRRGYVSEESDREIKQAEKNNTFYLSRYEIAISQLEELLDRFKQES